MNQTYLEEYTREIARLSARRDFAFAEEADPRATEDAYGKAKEF